MDFVVSNIGLLIADAGIDRCINRSAQSTPKRPNTASDLPSASSSSEHCGFRLVALAVDITSCCVPKSIPEGCAGYRFEVVGDILLER